MKKGEYALHNKLGTVRILSNISSMYGDQAYVVVTYDNKQYIVGDKDLERSNNPKVQIREEDKNESNN